MLSILKDMNFSIDIAAWKIVHLSERGLLSNVTDFDMAYILSNIVVGVSLEKAKKAILNIKKENIMFRDCHMRKY